MPSAASSGRPISPTATSCRSTPGRTTPCCAPPGASRRQNSDINGRKQTMSLHGMLLARAAEGNPLRIGLIGAGKFGSMYLSQIPTTPGIHLLGIADLSPPRARENLARLGWKPEVTSAGSVAEARRHGHTHLTDALRALGSHPQIDIVIQATGA